MRVRRSSRVGLTATGSCRTARGITFDVVVADLSPGGCRIDDPAGLLAQGEQIRLTIAATGPHMAEVAWRRRGRVGIEFRSDLPEQVLQSIAGAVDKSGAGPIGPGSASPRRIL